MERWTVHLEGGPRRVNHAAIALGHKIYSFGGYCTGEDYENTRPMDVHVFNTGLYRWTALPTPGVDDPQYSECPYQRYGHTAVEYNGCAYIWGGRNDRNGACNIVYCFDLRTNKWLRVKVGGDIPGARDGHSACVIADKMYIFGGYEEQVDKFSNEIYMLDFLTMMWSFVKCSGKPASWRDFHSATEIAGNMYVFGGRSDRAGPYHTSNEIYCDKIQVFNVASRRWFEPVVNGYLPVGRRSHAAFAYKGYLYIFGGYNGLYDKHFNDVYRFCPETSTWSVITPKGDSPCARRRQCCCLVGDRLFLFGGTSPWYMDTHDVEFDLIDHSDLHVLDFAPTLRTLCLVAVIQHNLDTSFLPREIKQELLAMTTNSSISHPLPRIASG